MHTFVHKHAHAVWANKDIYGFSEVFGKVTGCEILENINHMGAPGTQPGHRLASTGTR